MTMSTGLFWMMIASLLVFFSRVVYCEEPIPENLMIRRSRSMKQQYVESRNATSVRLPALDDTSDSGTIDSRLTPTTYSFPNETCTGECIIDIRANESRDSDGNADIASDETLQPPASRNDEPSRSRPRIINFVPSSNINWLLHHLREFRPVDDSWLKVLAAILIQASASTSVHSGSSSVFKVAIAVAFSASLTALLLRYNNGDIAPRCLVKLGAIAYTIVMYEASVNDLPTSIRCIITVAFLIAVATVINA
ncbi:uncharacterized protein LOC127809588 [Diospyros lotus]|uniref:uncharacterized protein LOC127809588 n=1 Tax=Diospyros lotus TaxID=55363 RepID=UPI00225A6842|nr:uncharacterized protein LOC127809588 [Diospyros lotus]